MSSASSFATLALTLALVLLLSSSSHAFQCYHCIPNAKTDCSGAEEREPPVDCSGAVPYCRKMEQNVLGKTQYVYQCGEAEGAEITAAAAKNPSKLYYNTANDYVKASVYHCLTDKCNGATHKVLSSFAAVGILAVAWMLH